MNHQQTQTRPLLDAIVADTTAPQALRDDLRQALAMFDTSVGLDRQASEDRRRSAAAVVETRRHEPRRILAMLDAGKTVTVSNTISDQSSAVQQAAQGFTPGVEVPGFQAAIQPHDALCSVRGIRGPAIHLDIPHVQTWSSMSRCCDCCSQSKLGYRCRKAFKWCQSKQPRRLSCTTRKPDTFRRSHLRLQSVNAGCGLW